MTDDLRRRADELDRDDRLAGWRDQFHIPNPTLAYLDGNSLGMPPRRTLERVDAVMRGDWATDLIRSGSTGSTCLGGSVTVSRR